jgi:hypothetical protein
MSHPKSGSLGGEIIVIIMDIAVEGKQRSHNSIVSMFLELFDKVLRFVEDPLLVRGPNDNVAFWAEQTYEIVPKLGRTSLLGLSPALSSATTATPASVWRGTPALALAQTWASVAARLPPPS